MTRLFTVRDAGGNVRVEVSPKYPGKGREFFSVKAEAKAHRDTIDGSRVSRGPDHWRGSSQ